MSFKYEFYVKGLLLAKDWDEVYKHLTEKQKLGIQIYNALSVATVRDQEYLPHSPKFHDAVPEDLVLQIEVLANDGFTFPHYDHKVYWIY